MLMLKEQVLELIYLSDKPIIEVLRDAEKLHKSGLYDEDSLYIELRNYYLNGRREETK